MCLGEDGGEFWRLEIKKVGESPKISRDKLVWLYGSAQCRLDLRSCDFQFAVESRGVNAVSVIRKQVNQVSSQFFVGREFADLLWQWQLLRVWFQLRIKLSHAVLDVGQYSCFTIECSPIVTRGIERSSSTHRN